MSKYIVIGAGILGASAAYHLSKEGKDVTVIDRFDKGQATEAGAGIICPWLTNRKNEDWFKLVTEGAAYYPRLIKDLNGLGIKDIGYDQVGAINIFDTDEKLDQKYKIAKERQQQFPEMGKVSKLSSKEAQELFPLLSDEFGAIHISGGARISGKNIRNALLLATEKNGAKLLKDNAKLTANKTGNVSVHVDGKTYPSDKVIITAGVWAEELLNQLGFNLSISSEKAQILHLSMPEQKVKVWPVVMAPFGQYMLSLTPDRILIGTTQDTNDTTSLSTVKGVESILDKALHIAPGIKNATYMETKVGFRPFFKKAIPAIGYLPGYSNILFANGLGASGLTSGPYIGKELACLAVENKTELNLDSFTLEHVVSKR
ncbi:NAD(P)/FAD-dependent oxidoreductase [Saliterribacillus persicus]|uniref:D-amino-acid dehydrogenase n=1 Tax=Saliterribacillus persicus TaxID=930114 RepID=A0A368XGW1_9BACI|nr:FAD-binding oxidoreductase [Saliterribacillus persicus]RCW66426.1 D-amino-acid dehydrogenase [Saliterribacillus persicus]